MEKNEFESGEKSTLEALFGIFGLSGFLCKKQNPQTFNHLVCHKMKASIRTLIGEINFVATEKNEFDHRDESILFRHCLDISDHRES